MPTAFLFPGQGSQYPAMGRLLARNFPSIRETMEEAADLLGIDMVRILTQANEAELRATQVAQPAIFTLSIAITTLLREHGILADCVAGHSLGEFSALVTAGCISFADGLRLVQLRGELMAAACQEQPGAMAAIVGLSVEAVEALCRAPELRGQVCVANHNALNQVAISGEAEAVAKVSELARAAGALKAVPLTVAGAFHSWLMTPASVGLAEAVMATRFRKPAIPIVMNVTADLVRDPTEIQFLLIRQLTERVRWVESVKRLVALGCDAMIEVGPGRVLTGLTRSIAPQVLCHSANEQGLQGLLRTTVAARA